MVAGNPYRMRCRRPIWYVLLLIPLIAGAQTQPHVAQLPGMNGYQLHCSQQAFLERLRKAGITVVPDSITFSRYYYDTSVWVGKRTVEEKEQRVYYWRMLRFGYGKDTIPVVNLYFNNPSTDEAIVSSYTFGYFPRYGQTSTTEAAKKQESNKARRERWAAYRKTQRRYTRLLRREFVRKYIKA